MKSRVEEVGTLDSGRYQAAERSLWADAGAEPVERVVRLPRLGTALRLVETGEGPPVLFVHGGPNAGSSWAHLAARLPGRRCIVVDRPGTGLSAPYRINRRTARPYLRDLVPDILDALEIERADMVGSSTGSDCVLLAAAHHPERVQRTVHFGCPGFAPDSTMPLAWRIFTMPVLWRLAAALPISAKSVEATLRQLGHGTTVDGGHIPAAFAEWYVSLMRDTRTNHHEMEASTSFISLRGTLPEFLLTPAELASIEAPSYFLWGAHDPFGSPSVGHRMVDQMPHAEIEVLTDAGHLAWLDDIDYAATVVERHLAASEHPRP